jgi:predicted homoserine dehydrogenase-like protein
MLIVDTALERRERDGNPIQVGIIGAGFMGRGIALQIAEFVPGMRVAAISNRTIETAERSYREAGIEDARVVESVRDLEECVRTGQPAITDDAMLLVDAGNIDAIIEVTGEIEFGAGVVTRAIDNGKHVILMNAELDGTVGAILKVRADKAGVVITNADGDQPGVMMNLYRFVKSIGCRPILCGNIKGLHDVRRNPDTQAAFAKANFQKPRMVTSFADGTKISFEMCIVSNATGMKAGRRGMYGPTCEHVSDAAALFPLDQMLDGGIVDYIVGAQPSPGVFVLGYQDHPIQQRYLKVYKLGDGPVYTFYTPYHLCHFEAPLTVARAVLFGDAAVTPIGPPVTDVVTVAKRDLKAGDVIDGIGGFDCYGVLDNIDVSLRDGLLPMGLAEGCRLKRDRPMDQVLTYDDVEVPSGRLSDQLRQEQVRHFHG